MDLLGFLCLLIGIIGISIRISRLETHEWWDRDQR